jgi:hypothetical protein
MVIGQLSFYDKKSFNNVLSRLRAYFPITKRFNELNYKAITHTRIDLLNLQIDLENLTNN